MRYQVNVISYIFTHHVNFQICVSDFMIFVYVLDKVIIAVRESWHAAYPREVCVGADLLSV